MLVFLKKKKQNVKCKKNTYLKYLKYLNTSMYIVTKKKMCQFDISKKKIRAYIFFYF